MHRLPGSTGAVPDVAVLEFQLGKSGGVATGADNLSRDGAGRLGSIGDDRAASGRHRYLNRIGGEDWPSVKCLNLELDMINSRRHPVRS